MLPAIVLAILVSGGCLALVLNEYWLTAAQEELRSVTQSVALVAARTLANDDLLKLDTEPYQIADQARENVQRHAISQVVHGPVLPVMDVHLASITIDPATGQRESEETDESPNSALVIGRRDRKAGNAVSMLAPLLAGRSFADVDVTVEASVSNLIEGVRTFGPATVPAWPIAILESSSDSKVQTWKKEIEQRQGGDQYAWNPETREVESRSDGLPEILLLPKGPNGTNNCYLVSVGNDFQDDTIERQLKDGWSAEDLSNFGDLFTLKPGPLDLPATDDFSGVPEETLETLIGQVRILLLYTTVSGANGKTGVKVVRMVAGRLMHVATGSGGPQFIVQPAVIATRLAVLDEEAVQRGETTGNPYIYKLSITQ